MYILFSAVWDLKKKQILKVLGILFSLNIPTIPMALDRKDE
jgi:hypothetical protein